jgi:hypothetical protein
MLGASPKANQTKGVLAGTKAVNPCEAWCRSRPFLFVQFILDSKRCNSTVEPKSARSFCWTEACCSLDPKLAHLRRMVKKLMFLGLTPRLGIANYCPGFWHGRYVNVGRTCYFRSSLKPNKGEVKDFPYKQSNKAENLG